MGTKSSAKRGERSRRGASTPSCAAPEEGSKATGRAGAAAQPEAPSSKPKARKSTGAAAIAEAIVAGTADHDLAHYARALEDPREATATQAARVVEEAVSRKPQLGVGMIDVLVRLLLSKNVRVTQACANSLPVLARVAPARVARRLPELTRSFESASSIGKDGLVRTFAAMCSASVAYQKRLEEVLGLALAQADPKTLVRWTGIVLPALKGEPHARARAVVEGRLDKLPRPIAQKIADFLGVKLRPLYRG